MDLLSFIVSILPVIIIGFLIYKIDKEKESSRFLFKLFVIGISSCYPAAIMSFILGIFFPVIDNMMFIELLFYVFITIALVEEFCKWFFLYKVSYNHNNFDSSYDMIVYAVFVALGFACFENILYVSSYGMKAGLFRAITAIPGHASDGILMGIYLGLAKIKELNGNKKLSNRYKILSIIIPMIAHGIYDFCLFNGSFFFIIIFVFFIVFVDIYCIIKVIQISRNDFNFRDITKHCTFCGVEVNTNFCTKCGTKNI